MFFMYILMMYYQADANFTFNAQNPSLLKYFFHETVNKTTKILACIDNYHGDEMRHVWLLQGPPFWCATCEILVFSNVVVFLQFIKTNCYNYDRNQRQLHACF